MSTIALDTDVASAVLRQRTSPTLARQLAGKTLTITFVTVGELTKWTLVRQWGPQRKAGMQTFLSRLIVLRLLRCAKPGQARSLIPVGQIARVSSSKAAGTRKFTDSSVPSS
jgi:hypothetical protein